MVCGLLKSDQIYGTMRSSIARTDKRVHTAGLVLVIWAGAETIITNAIDTNKNTNTQESSHEDDYGNYQAV